MSGKNSYQGSGYRAKVVAILAIALLSVAASNSASAYVGESFLRIPGVTGDLRTGKYKGWVLFEAQYWGSGASQFPGGARYKAHGLNAGGRVGYSAPVGPRDGSGKLSLALDKRSAALKPLMESCLNKTVIPEVTYDESADLSRPDAEWGERPANVPAFYEYKLSNVQLSCPQDADALEQGFVLNFAAVELTNYKGNGEAINRQPAKLPPAPAGATKTFVATFIGSATDVAPVKDECPKLSEGPPESDYYALLSPDDVAKEKAKFAGNGGVVNSLDGMMFRGPDHLNVCRLPGVVRDPGHISPVTRVALGFNLDGGDGSGPPRPGVRPHEKFVSEDGRKGIDNQLLTVDGCIPGLRKNGLLTGSRNELMRNGTISVLVQVSGIDNMQHDNNVDVALLYSLDPMSRSASSQVLPNYTFRLTKDQELAPDFVRLHGRMENGVVMTDPIKAVTLHEGSLHRIILYDARIRVVFQPDGKIKGYISGYEDWRVLFNFWGPSTHFEQGMGFTCPGVYNAFKRAADGLWNPQTREFDGISATYDIEGIPAFIPPEQQKMIAEAKP